MYTGMANNIFYIKDNIPIYIKRIDLLLFVLELNLY